MPVMFSRRFRRDRSRDDLLAEAEAGLLANDREGAYISTMAVLQRPPARDEAVAIRVPTLVIVGEEDPTRTQAEARELCRLIPGALGPVIVPGAGHLVSIEKPELVNKAIEDFWVAGQ